MQFSFTRPDSQFRCVVTILTLHQEDQDSRFADILASRARLVSFFFFLAAGSADRSDRLKNSCRAFGQRFGVFRPPLLCIRQDVELRRVLQFRFNLPRNRICGFMCMLITQRWKLGDYPMLVEHLRCYWTSACNTSCIFWLVASCISPTVIEHPRLLVDHGPLVSSLCNYLRRVRQFNYFLTACFANSDTHNHGIITLSFLLHWDLRRFGFI